MWVEVGFRGVISSQVVTVEPAQQVRIRGVRRRGMKSMDKEMKDHGKWEIEG
jgi:hypothetical protein